ncbi:hypothetical protein Acr_25g0001880 [Actinidia rufa]|uniref:Uncharacterized protein n=1 Tax=Actinidia rufa TaxID=165716 RepID=A0A7J0GY74_9ERIC|nr:hypothetical protein Acr_25g0001880 [Actinidia rufa]
MYHLRASDITILSTPSLNEFMCLYALLKGLGSELGWLYFKASPCKNILKGDSSNVKGRNNRFYFISGDEWEFHSSIPRKEGAVWIPRSGRKPRVTLGAEPLRATLGAEPLLLQAMQVSLAIPEMYLAPRSLPEMTSSPRLLAQNVATSSSKGVVTSKVSESPSKKRALDNKSKGKQPPIPGEGSAAKSVPSEALGPYASVMVSATMAEKILAGVILPDDKEKVLPSTSAAGILQRVPIIIVPLWNLLSMRWSETQNRAIELEEALAEASAKEKKVIEEVKERNKKVVKLEARVAKHEKSQNLAKGRIIAVFKESEDFQERLPRQKRG